jgi:hypothetical protein
MEKAMKAIRTCVPYSVTLDGTNSERFDSNQFYFTVKATNKVAVDFVVSGLLGWGDEETDYIDLQVNERFIILDEVYRFDENRMLLKEMY